MPSVPSCSVATPEKQPKSEKTDYFRRPVRRLMVILIVAALIANAVMIGVFAKQNQPWAPLGPYPEQIVNLPHEPYLSPPESPGIKSGDSPTLHVKASEPWPDVRITATKCYSESGVQVRFNVQWSSGVPGGTQVETGFGNYVTEEGCRTSTFLNPVPPSVKVRALDILKTGSNKTVWTVNGQEIPNRPQGVGVSTLWESERFVIQVDP